MPQIIPLTSDPDRTFDVELGGNLLTLRTYYNPTVPGWYMDVEGVAKGLALVPFADVFESSPELQRTIGQMRLIVSDGADVVAESLPQDTSDPLAGTRVWRGSVEPDGAVNGDLWIDAGSTNLFLWSDDMVQWAASASAGCTIVADAVAGPDGVINADKIREGTANQAHLFDRNQALAATGAYTLATSAKSAERSVLILGMQCGGQFMIRWRFNLATGVASAIDAGGSGGMVSEGGGWYRCWLTATMGSTVAPIQRIQIEDNDSGPTIYTGNGTSGLYVAARQLEAGSTRGRYIPTTSASVSTIGRDLTYIRNVDSWVASSLPSRAVPEPRATLGSSAQLWWFAPGEWVSDDEAPTLDPVPGSGGYVVA